MRQPKPIKIYSTTTGGYIKLIGNPKDHMPYFSIHTGFDFHGWIEDRDLKRLRKWCDLCIKGQRKHRK